MSKFIPQTIKPVNRHVLIIPHFEQKKPESGVLLPEDYKPEQDRYITATVLDTAKDCNADLKTAARNQFSRGTNDIIVERSMVETMVIRDKKYHLILANYVVGILRDADEWQED